MKWQNDFGSIVISNDTLGGNVPVPALLQLVSEFSNFNAVRSGETPPAIILLANDDRAVPPLTNGLPYYTALCRAGIPCAYYAYPSGGHGFGFRTTFKYHDQMLHELTTWLNTLKASK